MKNSFSLNTPNLTIEGNFENKENKQNFRHFPMKRNINPSNNNTLFNLNLKNKRSDNSHTDFSFTTSNIRSNSNNNFMSSNMRNMGAVGVSDSRFYISSNIKTACITKTNLSSDKFNLYNLSNKISNSTEDKNSELIKTRKIKLKNSTTGFKNSYNFEKEYLISIIENFAREVNFE